MTATSSRLDSSPILPQFVLVDGGCPALFSVFTEFFRTRVESVYGSQPAALASIRERRSFICEMVVEKDTPKGLIVYQTALTKSSDLEIRNFSLLSTPSAESERVNLDMLKHVKAIASARFAHAIVAYTNSTQEREFLESQGFKTEHEQKLPSSSPEFTLRLRLEEERPLPSFKRMCTGKEGREVASPAGFPAQETSLAKGVSDEAPSGRIESCTLKREYIEQIRSGTKTFEARVRTGLFQRYQKGMVIRWYGSGSEILTRIVSVSSFPSFEEMLKSVGFKKFLPLAHSESQAAGEYHRIPGYSDKVKRFGAVAFELEIVSPTTIPEGSRKRDRPE